VETVVVDHPIVRSRLTVMRDERSSNAEFRAALRELATLLVYEATRNLPATDRQVITPIGLATGSMLTNPPLLVPVLRAGLGMAEAAFNLLPESQMGFVGLARDETTHEPTPTWRRFPTPSPADPVLVPRSDARDRGLAAASVLQLLAARGAADVTVVCALAAPEGGGPDRRQRSGEAPVHRECGRGPRRQCVHRAGPRRRPAIGNSVPR
jgi:uracil phosphoribosyltransferase